MLFRSISKWQLAEAALQTGGVLPLIGVCILLLSALLTALYMLSISIRAFFSPLQMLPGLPIPKESGWRMLLPLCLFAVLVLVMGIHPQPFLRLVSAIAQGTF